MNERYDVPETTGSIRRITRDGDDRDYQDVMVGLEVRSTGILQIDLRNMRPLRVNDRDGVVLELYLADVLRAVAVGVEQKVKADSD